jgi:hypothetical protein
MDKVISESLAYSRRYSTSPQLWPECHDGLRLKTIKGNKKKK